VNSMLRKTLPLFLLVTLMSCTAPIANAWGASGHRIVAIIAARHLKPQARQRIAQILGPHVSLESVANYADAVRNSRPETYNFHFVDIPKSANNYDPDRDCRMDPEKGDCVIAALERFKAQVNDPHESLAKRRFALKFIVHLVGDLHQPLHCADNNNDHGGGRVNVKWFGTSTNLHKVWDTEIIDAARLTDNEFADALDSDLTAAQIQTRQQGTVLQWVLESHRLAREHAYAIPDNKELDQEYYDANSGIVDEQLLRGGLRLAKFLNSIFAP
jgi:hypothetical protein